MMMSNTFAYPLCMSSAKNIGSYYIIRRLNITCTDQNVQM